VVRPRATNTKVAPDGSDDDRRMLGLDCRPHALWAGTEASTATPCCRLFSSAVRYSARHARPAPPPLAAVECQTACECVRWITILRTGGPLAWFLPVCSADSWLTPRDGSEADRRINVGGAGGVLGASGCSPPSNQAP
jgi:hypothetical protein